MAKKETKYICEVCGKKHDALVEAEECEKLHYRPIGILKTDFDFTSDKKSLYPTKLNIKLKDGFGKEKTIRYIRG